VFAGGGAGGGFSDFFETLFRRGQAGHGDPFGAQRGRPGAGPQRTPDTRAKLSVSLETVYAGDTVRVSVHGKTLDVKIPKGIGPGQVIRLAGQGANGGALLLEIEYSAHPQFEVDGRNIIHVLPIAPWEAALGAMVSVPTLGGAVELKIPAKSEAGAKLRSGLAGGSRRRRSDRRAGGAGSGGEDEAAGSGLRGDARGFRQRLAPGLTGAAALRPAATAPAPRQAALR